MPQTLSCTKASGSSSTELPVTSQMDAGQEEVCSSQDGIEQTRPNVSCSQVGCFRSPLSTSTAVPAAQWGHSPQSKCCPQSPTESVGCKSRSTKMNLCGWTQILPSGSQTAPIAESLITTLALLADFLVSLSVKGVNSGLLKGLLRCNTQCLVLSTGQQVAAGVDDRAQEGSTEGPGKLEQGLRKFQQAEVAFLQSSGFQIWPPDQQHHLRTCWRCKVSG